MEWNARTGRVAEWNAQTDVWRIGMRKRTCDGDGMRERDVWRIGMRERDVWRNGMELYSSRTNTHNNRT